MPEVSVIIPVYNVESKIRRCLDSLMEQTFTDFECILVDDGSSDNSGVICDEYMEINNRFRVIHQKNAGVSSARNNGINNARGTYITFIDSDDYVHKDYLKILCEKMLNNQELVICGVHFYREGIGVFNSQTDAGDYELKLIPENAEIINDLIQDRRFNYVYAKIYRTDIIQNNNIKFDQAISLGEDTLFVMDYLQHVHCCYIVGASYYYYIKYVSGTLTGRFYQDIYQKYTFINDRIEAAFREKGINVEDSINLRQLESSRWAINSIRNATRQSKKSKIQLVDNILKSKKLQAALDKNYTFVKDFPEFEVMKKRSGRKLLAYYKKIEVKEEVVLKIKVLILKVIPRNFVGRLKDVFRLFNNHSSV